MKEKKFCENFYKELNKLIVDLDIEIIACAIKKEVHMSKYGIDAIDPYHLSLRVLVERFCFELKNNGQKGQIIAEARDSVLDRQLDLAWLDLKVSGTQFVQAIDVSNNIISLILKRKEDNLAGLEIADAIVTPIARSLLNRK